MKKEQTKNEKKEKFEPYYLVEIKEVETDKEDDPEDKDIVNEGEGIVKEGTYRGHGVVEKAFKVGTLFERKANAYRFILHLLQEYDENDFGEIYCHLITGEDESDFIDESDYITVYYYDSDWTRWEEREFKRIVAECGYMDKYFQSSKP